MTWGWRLHSPPLRWCRNHLYAFRSIGSALTMSHCVRCRAGPGTRTECHKPASLARVASAAESRVLGDRDAVGPVFLAWRTGRAGGLARGSGAQWGWGLGGKSHSTQRWDTKLSGGRQGAALPGASCALLCADLASGSPAPGPTF